MYFGELEGSIMRLKVITLQSCAVFMKLPLFKLQVVHFSTYDTFSFCYYFQIKSKNMVLFVLGHFINFIEFDFYFSQKFFFFFGVFFPIF